MLQIPTRTVCSFCRERERYGEAIRLWNYLVLTTCKGYTQVAPRAPEIVPHPSCTSGPGSEGQNPSFMRLISSRD